MSERIEDIIIVAGHAPFADEVKDAPEDSAADKYWFLQNFQQGEPPFYIEHIEKGVKELKHQPNACLYFSGGQTRAETHWSEADTYYKIAEHFGFWEPNEAKRMELIKRIDTEQYARDSFENLKFCLLAFYQRFSKYPQLINVVGWTFKEARFDFHRQTLGIPDERYRYVGVNNPNDLEGALRGEEKALAQFRADPYGERPPLSVKRAERNPFGIVVPYSDDP